MKFLFLLIILFIFLPFSYPVKAVAAEKEKLGFDISYPQCPSSFPDREFSFAVIGVNGGKAFLPNTCLFNQDSWAKRAKARVSLYMNLNYPSGDTSSYGTVGFLGICAQDFIEPVPNWIGLV